MAAYSPSPRGRTSGLTDRRSERGVLDRLVTAVLSGKSRVLVVRGDPGVGKTVLLDHLADQAAECRVMRAAGIQLEMELAFAGLHQLCAPAIARAETAGQRADTLRLATTARKDAVGGE